MHLVSRFASFACLCLLSLACRAQPGQVLVVFKIDSPMFKAGLGQNRAAAETALAENIAKQLQGRFPPIEWLTTDPANGAAATLTLALQEDDAPIPNVMLHWDAKIGSKTLMLRDTQDWPVYEERQVDRPYRKKDQLIAEIGAKFTTRLHTQPTEDVLQDEFIRHIPLTDHVVVVPAQQLVVIPLPWQRSKIAGNSRFRVELLRPAPAGDLNVVLSNAGPMRLGELRGNTRSTVAACDTSGTAISGDLWNSCGVVFNQKDLPPYNVRFDHYFFSDDVEGMDDAGTAVSP